LVSLSSGLRLRDKLLVKPLLSPLVGNNDLLSTAVEEDSPEERLSPILYIKKIN